MPTDSRPQSSRFKGVLIDLDGTLIDHFATLYQCYAYTLGKLDQPVPAADVVRRSVGGSMEVTMRKFVGEGLVEEAAAIWREHLSTIYLDDVKLMAGGLWLVETLHARGFRLGVFTNKIGKHSRGVCEHLAVDGFLAMNLGANDTPFRKPQPEFTALALEKLSTTAAETCLLGDSPYDLAAAHAGGIPCFCVTTGTHTNEELTEAKADGIFADLFELGEKVFGLARP
jgi:phosphoglycolate phosphatase